MNYRVISMEKSFRCYAKVLTEPNWIGRNILRKKRQVLRYTGLKGYWMDKNFNPPNKRVKALLDRHYHIEYVAKRITLGLFATAVFTAIFNHKSKFTSHE